MSWTEELYKIYEYNSGREFDDGEPVMLPVAHSTANAQIELTIDLDGEFVDAKTVDKADAVTVIPATESSATRTSGVSAMPYADKLIYIAGDYSNYANGRKTDNSAYHSDYMDQLKNWMTSEYSHEYVKALYLYLEKGCLISDLVRSGVIKLDETTGKFKEKEKIAGISQEDSFVRIRVNTKDASVETWKDRSFQKSFIGFNSSSMGEKQLCYASGEYAVPTYKHPVKIRNSGDKAKIISANDESGFTFRGRFADKEQAVSVGYNYSQEIHTALRWLREKQGKNFDSLTVIVWASAMQKIPSFEKSAWDDEDEEEIPSTYPYYAEMLEKRIFSIGRQLEPDTKVMIMGLDAATKGRINISMYSEIESSRYLENIEKWHKETAWLRYSSKQKKSGINSFSLYDIVKYAFGTEQGAFVDCDKKIMRDNIIRLINCVTNGAKLPDDIMNSLCRKASNPLAYENGYNHLRVLEIACGMIRKNYTDHKKGVVSMAFDPNNHDRSYLFGCLLAIADKAESDTYDVNEKRVTNARRLWSAFSSRPYQTWKIIEERLEPYLEKDNRLMTRYTKLINEVMAKFTPEGFADNSKLSPLYLIGYHHYNALLWTKKEDKNEEEK